LLPFFGCQVAMKMIMQTTAILETFLKGSKASVQLKPPEMDKKSVNMLSSNAEILGHNGWFTLDLKSMMGNFTSPHFSLSYFSSFLSRSFGWHFFLP